MRSLIAHPHYALALNGLKQGSPNSAIQGPHYIFYTWSQAKNPRGRELVGGTRAGSGFGHTSESKAHSEGCATLISATQSLWICTCC